MIANNDEAKRSKIWTVVTAVTSVLIVIIAIFLLMKMFTGNPLEGSWTDEDGNMDLKIGRNGQMTVILPRKAVFLKWYVCNCYGYEEPGRERDTVICTDRSCSGGDRIRTYDGFVFYPITFYAEYRNGNRV